jgi:arsenite methyltransferase
MKNAVKMNDDEIKEFVKKSYAKLATSGRSCCSDSSLLLSGIETAALAGYSHEELKGLPAQVKEMFAGCGNPLVLSELKVGETVLDIGSGGGLDVFLAAKKVGTTGRVVGIDFTREMIRKATRNAKGLGLRNVEFRLGDAEDMPVETTSVDVVISNCVINLAPDKDKVFKEAYRVLKPGGRMIISDIVTEGRLPKEIRRDRRYWAGCVAGALEIEDYLRKIRKAGFKHVKVLSRTNFTKTILSIIVNAQKRED